MSEPLVPNRSWSRFAGLLAGSALLAGCGEDKTFHYADDVVVQYTDGEKVASLKNQLGCEGAHPPDKDEKETKAREENIPKTEQGIAWLKQACELADVFDSAGPVTSWPERKVSYSGVRICRPQIQRAVKDLGDAYAQLGHVEINKGVGTKLWSAGPDVPEKDRILDYNILLDHVNYRVGDETVATVVTFINETAAGGAPDPTAANATQTAADNELAAGYKKGVTAHRVPGILLKSDGKSTLAYPFLGGKDAPSAVHYIREHDGKLLIATPMLDASSPSGCIASLSMDK